MKQDVLILGGGIVGVSIGFYLARAGLRPLVIEPGAIAGGTTGASFAWANGSTKTSDADYHRLNADGLALHHALLAEFGGQALGIRHTGALQAVATSDAAGHRAMTHDAQALAGFGYASQRVDHQALCGFEPDLNFPLDTCALHLPDDLILDAPHFTRFLANQMCATGGTVLNATPTGLIADDNGVVSGVTTSAGPLHAPLVILAAGKDTGALLAYLTGYAPFASRFPLREVPGVLLTTPPLPERLNHLIYTSTMDELHILPTPGGGIKIGSDDSDALVWHDHSHAAQRAGGHALLERAGRFLPGLSKRISVDDCLLQIGIRAVPEDGRSIIGPLPGAEGLYVIATHSGVTLAPIIASLMSKWITTGKQPAQLAPFGLSRFAGFG